MYHGDLNPSNIIVDPETLKLVGIIDWEFCCNGFDDYSFEFFESWVDDDKEEMRLIVTNKLSNKSNQWYKKSNGELLRKYLKELILTAQQLTFYVSSWFNQIEYEKRRLEVRQHISTHAQLLDEQLCEWENIYKYL